MSKRKQSWLVGAIAALLLVACDDSRKQPSEQNQGGTNGGGGNSGGSGGTEAPGGRGGAGGVGGSGGTGAVGGAGGSTGPTAPDCEPGAEVGPDALCSWICNAGAWQPIPRGAIIDCTPAEALPEMMPFERMQWASVGPAMDESLLTTDSGYDPVITTELGPDGYHAVMQVTHSETCGASKFRIRRLIDVTTGHTLGAYRIAGACTTGPIAPDSAMLGAFIGHDSSDASSPSSSHLAFGSRTLTDGHWFWWSEPVPAADLYGDDFHDLADGTLVFRRNSSVRVTVERGSSELVVVDGKARAGSAGDNLFVWSQLLEPSGSRVRAWSRESGVTDVVHAMVDDPCAVTASASHVVGITGVGGCTQFLSELKFWRLPQESMGKDSAVVAGPAIVSAQRLGMTKLLAYGDYASAIFVPEVAAGVPGAPFVLVARFSDQSLWQVGPRTGSYYSGPNSYTLTDKHIFTIERHSARPTAVAAVQRIPLSHLNATAVQFQ